MPEHRKIADVAEAIMKRFASDPGLPTTQVVRTEGLLDT
jgi:hypothetical protein